MKTRATKLDTIQPHPDNVNQGDIGAICESLEFHGQYRAIVVSEATGNILAGNHTYLAAKQLGWTSMLAHWLPDLTAEQEMRIMLADNAYARKATTDSLSLSEILSGLAVSPDAFLGTGYDGDDLDQLLADLTGTPGNDGDIGEPSADSVTELGDVWLLGRHRLICGDATDPDVWSQIPRYDVLWTDPPYGVDYEGGTSDRLKIANDRPADAEAVWVPAFTLARQHAKDTTTYYITGPPGDLFLPLASAVAEAGWQLKQTLIWAKNSLVLGHSDYHYQHEPVLYGWNKTHHWYGDRTQTTLLQHDRPSTSPQHPTMKPISLIEQCLTNSTPPTRTVIDPFAGFRVDTHRSRQPQPHMSRCGTRPRLLRRDHQKVGNSDRPHRNETMTDCPYCGSPGGHTGPGCPGELKQKR